MHPKKYIQLSSWLWEVEKIAGQKIGILVVWWVGVKGEVERNVRRGGWGELGATG